MNEENEKFSFALSILEKFSLKSMFFNLLFYIDQS